ncbi:PepSY domain-containing protein [Ornithinibacillus bavariensis]|uniref:PepSY domain-containing protein n=1 Tax=Ornithinibacillus bavariensis TaxID=545502 RepID=UPI000EDDA1FF|nr:hypothetical protein [Ornithinibacillus sp.]
MKKKVVITIASVVVASLLGFGLYHTNAAQADPKLTRAEIEELVSAQYPGTITEIELDKSFNRVVYEVEVEGNGKKYEIKLDGNTGEILQLEEEVLKVTTQNSTDLSIKDKANTEDSKSEKGETSTDVDKDKINGNDSKAEEQKQDDTKSEEKQQDNGIKVAIDYQTAKKIALAEFDGIITELQLDEDDGRYIYEVEIEGPTGEAELDIDANTGEIISISIDTELGDIGKNGNSNGQSDDLD